MDRLDGVAVFVEVVEAGSFTLAAEGLNLTRSAIGKAIAKLEQRLGARLLHRTTRTQTLTEAGQTFYERCKKALAELDAAEVEIENGRIEPRGRLTVSAPIAFGHDCVAPALFALARRYPALQIDISFTDRAVDLIEENIDMAVRIGDLPGGTRFDSHCLGIQEMRLGAAPSYLARYGMPATPEDFAAHTGIGYSRAGVVSPWFIVDDEGVQRSVPVKAQVSLDDIQAIAQAGIEGLGLVRLPCWLLNRYEAEGKLVTVEARCELEPKTIHAIWPKSSHLPLKVRCAIDALVDAIPAMNLT